MRRVTITSVLISVLMLYSSAWATTAIAATAIAEPIECNYIKAGVPARGDVGLPVKPYTTATVKATLKTNLGDVALSLDGEKAPCTTTSFLYLAGKNYFDETNCHRLTTGALKVLQCGDPTGTGGGGPGYQFGEENLPQVGSSMETATYAKGTLAMANAGPGTSGSQFFLVYGDSELPPMYTVFGKITAGMDLLEQVASAGTDNANGEGDGAPINRVTIQDVAISAADLSISLDASTNGLLAPTMTITATATNHGPGTADTAQVTFTYPAGLTNPNAPGCAVNTDAHTLTCDLGAIAAGASTSKPVHLTAGLLTIGDLTVTAARSSTPEDPNPANDTASATCQALTGLLVRC